VARTLALRAKDPFWQARYYDFNVWSEKKFVEKLRYIHRNPVARGLVNKPEDWPWSSFRHYLTGAEGTVEIGSQWTAEGEDGNLPEGAGALEMKAPPKQSLDGAPERVRVGQPPRGLVNKPEDWPWSSFRHYLTGAEGTVEIESQWTARRREKMGIFPKVRVRSK